MTTAQATEQRDFAQPDEVRTFPLGHADILEVGGAEIGRLVFQPGWRWSEHVKPIAGTELCQAPHFQYHLAGTLRSRWPTAASSTPRPARSPRCRPGTMPGSSATRTWWSIDWFGASEYAK